MLPGTELCVRGQFLYQFLSFTCTGDKTILDYVMKEKAKPQREENLVDLDGSTALHLFAVRKANRIPYNIVAEDRYYLINLSIYV